MSDEMTSVAEQSAAAEAAVGGSNEITGKTATAEAGADNAAQNVQADDAAKVAEVKDEEVVFDKNRWAEMKRKQARSEKLREQISKLDEDANSLRSTLKDKKAVLDSLKEDEDGLVTFEGRELPKDVVEEILTHRDRLGRLEDKMLGGDKKSLESQSKAELQAMEDEYRAGMREVADKVFPNLDKDAKDDLYEFLDDKAQRMFDKAAENGEPLSDELCDNILRECIAKARRFGGRLAQAQLVATDKARTETKVKPDVGTQGEEVPPDESKLTREQLAKIQAERTAAAEAATKRA
jgi:hypothetical protein